MGRPSLYTPEIADTICERLAMGESLRSICRGDDMPALSTVFRWLTLEAGFTDQYARAREEQAECLADEIVDISDEESITTRGEDGEVVVVFDSTAVARNRLRIDSRKWVASKLKPKKYGDRVAMDHGGQPGNPFVAMLAEISGTSFGPTAPDDHEDDA